MPKIVEKPLAPELAGRRLLSAKETMQLLGVSKKKLHEMTFLWAEPDRLRSYKIGGSRKYRADEIHYYIDLHAEAR